MRIMHDPTKSKKAMRAAGLDMAGQPLPACMRCGEPAPHIWSGCVMNGAEIHLCGKCDLEINALFLQFLGIPNWREVKRRYKKIRDR